MIENKEGNLRIINEYVIISPKKEPINEVIKVDGDLVINSNNIIYYSTGEKLRVEGFREIRIIYTSFDKLKKTYFISTKKPWCSYLDLNNAKESFAIKNLKKPIRAICCERINERLLFLSLEVNLTL